MTRQALVMVIVAGCSSSSKPGQPVDAGATPEPDAAAVDAAVDAAPDGPVVQGAACPSELIEVARIPSAAGDAVFNYRATLRGDIDAANGEDVVVVDHDFRSAQSPVRIRAFLRSGGGFAAPVTSSFSFPSGGPEQILLGDVNGDRLADVLLSFTTDFPRTSSVYVATQQADHHFVLSAPRNVSACGSSQDERLFALAVIDTDRDGVNDVLATVSYGGLGAVPAGVSRLAGGAGGLGLATCVVSATVSSGFPSTLITAERLIAEDFNGDGATDLAALFLGRFDPARGIIDQVFVFPSTGASQFRVAPNEVRYTTGNQFRIDHVPGRTRQHLARLRVDTSTASATRLRIDDTGVTATEAIATFPGGSNGAIVSFPFATGDFNRDGLSDVIEAIPATQRFDIACDRVARWDATHGAFPVQVFDLASFDFAQDGPSYVMALTSPDLVFYKLQ